MSDAGYRVFISYATPDKAVADAFCEHLERIGIRCWIAPRNIRVGRSWPSEIDWAIEHTEVMLLIFSSSSNGSKWVQKELTVAASKSRMMMPVRIEDVLPGRELSFLLADTQWLDAFTEPRTEHMERVAAALREYLKPPDVLPEDAEPASPGSEEPASEEPALEEPGMGEPAAEARGPQVPGPEEPGPEEPGPEEPGPEAPAAQSPGPEEPAATPIREEGGVEEKVGASTVSPAAVEEAIRKVQPIPKPMYYGGLKAIPLEWHSFLLMIGGYVVAVIVSNSFMKIENDFPKGAGAFEWLWKMGEMYAQPFLPYAALYWLVWMVACGFSSGLDQSVRGFVERVVLYAAILGAAYTLFGGRDWLLWFSLVGAIVGGGVAIAEDRAL